MRSSVPLSSPAARISGLGSFSPGPAYPLYAKLFERERELNEGMNVEEGSSVTKSDEWLAAFDAINELNLLLDGIAIRDLKIDRDEECEFKYGE